MKAAICRGGCQGLKFFSWTSGSSVSVSGTRGYPGSFRGPEHPKQALAMSIKTPIRVILFAIVDLLCAQTLERETFEKDDGHLTVRGGGYGRMNLLHALGNDLPQFAGGPGHPLVAGQP